MMFLSLSILKIKNYMFSFFDTSIISSIEENKKIKFKKKCEPKNTFLFLKLTLLDQLFKYF